MTTTGVVWSEAAVEVAGLQLHLRRAGSGKPLLVLHHDIGTLDRVDFYDRLAGRFEVLVPDQPGHGRSERPDWMRHPRDLAAVYQWLLAEFGLEQAALVGLGFGGWVAAEMASLAPRDFSRLVLVGAMGIKPPEGDIRDQALLSYVDYVRYGFHDQAAYARAYGEDPTTDQLEQWDISREMSFRIAWKPYMYSQTLPHLLGGVRAPALVVWGDDDQVVPLSSGRRYAELLSNARLEIVPSCGHLVELEQPQALATLVTSFVG
jgi:pimeloyl-ACP methyl ester carboxylesterase